MFMLTLQQVLKLFVFMLIGFMLHRTKTLPDETASILSKLEVNLLLPCLTFRTFAENFTLEKLTSDPELLIIALISSLVTLIVGTLIGRHIGTDHYEQNVCIYSINCPNTGYVGTPLVLGLFGAETLMKMLIFTIPLVCYTYSEGYRLLTDKRGISIRNFIAPPLIAMFLGAFVGLLRIPIPAIFGDVISGCADCMAPLAMVLTGCIIAQFRFRDILRDPHIYEVVLLRMVAVPLVVLSIARLLDVSHEMMVLLAAVFAMPTGLNTIVVPASMNRDCHLGAGMTCVSNIFGLLSIPLFFAIFL